MKRFNSMAVPLYHTTSPYQIIDPDNIHLRQYVMYGLTRSGCIRCQSGIMIYENKLHSHIDSLLNLCGLTHIDVSSLYPKDSYIITVDGIETQVVVADQKQFVKKSIIKEIYRMGMYDTIMSAMNEWLINLNNGKGIEENGFIRGIENFWATDCTTLYRFDWPSPYTLLGLYLSYDNFSIGVPSHRHYHLFGVEEVEVQL